jgi:uncharacterized iron-regulated membrane protein
VPTVLTSTFRRTLARLHRWTGLASGLVVFIVGITGAIYVWEVELFRWVHRELVTVAPASQRASADLLVSAAQAAVQPGRRITRITVYADPARAAMGSTQRVNPNAATHFSEYEYFDEVYINPYTAAVLGVVDRKHDPIYLTRVIHTNLLLAKRGEWIVGVATLVFMAMCLSGLTLWWPRTRAVLRERLRPRLTRAWKRAVFDAHNVLGVYSLIGLLLVAITGPVWTWRWYEASIAFLFTGRAELVGEPVPVAAPIAADDSRNAASAGRMEHVLTTTQQRVPDAERWFIELGGGKSPLLTVGAVYDRASLWEEYERHYFHPQTGELLGDELFEEKNLGMKWRNTNYGIHTGSLFGWPSKVLACLLSLFAASLPVTGLLIWYPRYQRQRAHVLPD